MKSKWGKARLTPTRTRLKARFIRDTSSVGDLDKGEYEGANESAVDERIRGNCHAWEDAMRLKRPCRTLLPSEELVKTASGRTNPVMSDPEDDIDRT